MKSVANIQGKDERAFFVERVDIYIRLLECYALKNRKSIPKATLTDDVTKEIISIGFISSEKDIALLKDVLGADRLGKLSSCVKFYLANQSEELDAILTNIRDASRKILQRKEKSRKAPTLVDFFCGAGGLSCGFRQAGFKVVLANDIQDVCCETYRYNHPELPDEAVVQGDIKAIVNNLEDYVKEPVDMVVGGPPCQGFSSANQQRIIDDPRNELYKYFVKAVEKICPKLVVMENVRGMLPYANQVVEDYQNIKANKGGKTYHYLTSYKLLSSECFNVAQTRVRLIYVAIRNDVAEKFTIRPSDIYDEIEKSTENNHGFNLSSALEGIKPLESPRVKHLTDKDDEKTGKKIDINDYKGNENAYLRLINGGREIPFVFNHKARYASPTNYEIFRRLKQGEDGTSASIAGIMPYERRKNIFKDKYYKLIADKPCRTITAHLRMDCLSHIHPTQVRTISPREAARVQSFPDDYMFLGAYLKTYMQIGNAVPVLMARQIATILKKYI